MEYFGAAFSCNVLYFSMFCHCRPANGGLYCTGRRTRYKSCNNKVRSGYGSPKLFFLAFYQQIKCKFYVALMTWKCTGVNDLTTITCVLMISHGALQQNLQPPSRLSVKLTIMYNETSNRILVVGSQFLTSQDEGYMIESATKHFVRVAPQLIVI